MAMGPALRDHGVENFRCRPQLAAPGTTAGLSEKGRAKWEESGIAPPQPAGGPEKRPHCGSKNVTLVSQFGSTPCKAHWRCQDCLEPFDYFKCI